MKLFKLLSIVLGFSLFFSSYKKSNVVPLIHATDTTQLYVPLGGNSWLTVKDKRTNEEVTEEGWKNWQSTKAVFSTYIKVNKVGKLTVFADLSVPEGKSTVRCTINGVSKTISVTGSSIKEYKMGTWDIASAGHIKIDMQGIDKTGEIFANATQLKITGAVVNAQTAFVKNNEGNYFYWGRRGPSVHLNYDITDAGNEIEWFYNEITVPVGNDVVGSYFMANGFGEGYFGIQVNSDQERRVLFSVWSPFETDDPSKIPADKKIVLLKKGETVHTGEFGNEGSGGQSYLKYDWKAGNTYRFLLKGEPVANDHTDYTAYFFAPEVNKWMLIASFSRPATHTYLTNLHSFLENFDPETGNIDRKAFYQNQWIRDKKGGWKAIAKATFTGDATAQKAYRLDYAGGVEDGGFLLSNCGFFNDNTVLRSRFSHDVSNPAPVIDLAGLE